MKRKERISGWSRKRRRPKAGALGRREHSKFEHFPHALLEKLSAIRLTTLIETSKQKAQDGIRLPISLRRWILISITFADVMQIADLLKKTKITFSVYTQ